ncbi:MAG: polysaccharide deacetylase family protein [Smithellaceae bacterium]|jgi:hypothetical protein|nr:polysaccharide deacetylase family protein [Smithellaceae bacterium]
MKMKTWTTSAGLQWLEAILQERFGHAFSLQQQTDGALLLILPGSDRSITLTTDLATYTRADSALPCTKWDVAAEGWHTALRPKLPAPGAEKLPTPLITPTTQGLHIGYDILGLTYWMLSRQEEVGRIDLDAHRRFPAASSHAFKHSYLERPIVDEWLNILGQVIERVWPGIVLKKHRFSMKVSHDVDEPSRYGFRNTFGLIRAMGGDVLKRRAFKDAFFAPWIRMSTKEKLHPRDPYNNFDWLMDTSERHSLISAFYFIASHSETSNGTNYDISHPALRNLLRHIHKRGHEIGLHPGYHSFLDPIRINNEAQILRQVCAEEGISQNQWGGRMHYLQWRQPVTLRAWNDAGMTYDSTLTYADHSGFRCGTCFEYPAFDPVVQKSIPLRIRPLIVMEGSVIGEQYMNLGVSASAVTKILELKEACRRVTGCFTLLWHNSSLSTKVEKDMYQTVLGHA